MRERLDSMGQPDSPLLERRDLGWPLRAAAWCDVVAVWIHGSVFVEPAYCKDAGCPAGLVSMRVLSRPHTRGHHKLIRRGFIRLSTYVAISSPGQRRSLSVCLSLCPVSAAAALGHLADRIHELLL